MAEYYNFENDANVSIEVVEKNIDDNKEAPKAYNEEEVFEKKPKPKRVLTDAQKDALQRGRAKAKATREAKKMGKAEKDKVDNKKIDEFNELKYTCLGNCDDEEQFDKLDSILSKYITKADILKGDDHLRNKVGQVVSLLKK